MNAYTEFITGVYECICDTFEANEHTLEIFAEGHDHNPRNVQEYAILRDEKAKTFVAVIRENKSLFDVSENDYKLEQSKVFTHEVRISHSCYPKNLRRWLKGTISRKKKCRIEFCVLAYCHAMNWKSEAVNEAKYLKCRKRLTDICNEYLTDSRQSEFSMNLLWKACCVAYDMSAKK